MAKFFKKYYKYTPLGWWLKGYKKLGWEKPDELFNEYLDGHSDGDIALQIGLGLVGAGSTSGLTAGATGVGSFLNGLFGSKSKSKSKSDEDDNGEYDPSMDEDEDGSSGSSGSIKSFIKSLAGGNGTLNDLLKTALTLSAGITSLNNQKHLSGAQKEQNAWAEQQATTSYERQREYFEDYLSAPAQVRQYKEAGLNPMMLAGGAAGATSPSVDQASSNTMPNLASNILGDLLNYDARLKEIGVQQQRVAVDSRRVDVMENLLPGQLENYFANAESNRKRALWYEQGVQKMAHEMDEIDARIDKIYSEVDYLDAKTFIAQVQGKYVDESERARIANLWKDMKVKDSQISKNEAEAALAWAQENLTDITAAYQGELMQAQTEASWSRAALNYAQEAITNFEKWYMSTHNGSKPPSGMIGALQGICASMANNISSWFGYRGGILQ